MGSLGQSNRGRDGAREIDDVPEYFHGLRAIIRRVVTDTTESGLSEEEKQELIQRLLAHVADGKGQQSR
jgi:hypothetical protein